MNIEYIVIAIYTLSTVALLIRLFSVIYRKEYPSKWPMESILGLGIILCLIPVINTVLLIGFLKSNFKL